MKFMMTLLISWTIPGTGIEIMLLIDKNDMSSSYIQMLCSIIDLCILSIKSIHHEVLGCRICKLNTSARKKRNSILSYKKVKN